MTNGNGNGDRFGRWMSNGLAATTAWGVVLVIYCTFRALKIEDPMLGQAFLLLTGAWVASLTFAQSRKTAEAEEKAAKAEKKAEAAKEEIDDLKRASDTSIRRADASERREGERSRHRAPAAEGGDEFYD